MHSVEYTYISEKHFQYHDAFCDLGATCSNDHGVSARRCAPVCAGVWITKSRFSRNVFVKQPETGILDPLAQKRMCQLKYCSFHELKWRPYGGGLALLSPGSSGTKSHFIGHGKRLYNPEKLTLTTPAVAHDANRPFQ